MWASHFIERLAKGETVSFRPRGNSMSGKIESGQLVTVEPRHGVTPVKGDIVLCRVAGKQFLHLISAVGQDGRFQISNNRGHINGWCRREDIYGVVVSIAP